MFTTHFSTKKITLAAALAFSVALSACGPGTGTRAAVAADADPAASFLELVAPGGVIVDPLPVDPLPTIAVTTTAVQPTLAIPTTAPSTTAPAAAGPTGLANPTVPGEPIDFGPEAGRPLTIVGVSIDDVLNFRIAPSPNAALVTSHPVTLTELDIYTLGEAWAAPSGVWWKVNVMGTEAWANQAYLAIRGGSVPIFDEVAQDLQILMAGSIEELALDVAATRATVEPLSRITIVTEPVITPLGDGGAVGHVFVDVLDLGDHLQKGERLSVEFDVVFDLDTPEPNDIAFIVLHGVEMIYLQAH